MPYMYTERDWILSSELQNIRLNHFSDIYQKRRRSFHVVWHTWKDMKEHERKELKLEALEFSRHEKHVYGNSSIVSVLDNCEDYDFGRRPFFGLWSSSVTFRLIGL